MNASDAELRTMLGEKTIAVVGLSPRPWRPSNSVSHYMRRYGYRIIPVNPGHDKIMGLKAYPSLSAIPEPVGIVDVFRRAEHTLQVAEEAVAIGARAFWLQLGIVNDAALQVAVEGGLLAVQDRCIKIEHARLGRPRPGL